MQSVTVLTTHGRRQVVKVEPNKTVLWILEEVCKKFNFDPNDFGLKHHNKLLDLSQMFRFAGLPNNTNLEMVTVDKKRVEQSLVICLQLEDGTRINGDFASASTLREIINSLCPNKSAADQSPVVIYMRSELFGDALDTVTLKSLGLSSGGRALLRLINTDPESLKVQANVSAPLPQKPKEPEVEKPRAPVNAGNSSLFQFTDIKQVMQVEKKPETVEEEPMEVEESSPATTVVPERPQTEQNTKQIEQQIAEVEEPEPVINVLDSRGTIIFSLDALQTSSIDPPDSFFVLDANEIQKLQRDAKKQVEEIENRPLMTSAWRKLEENKKILNQLSIYKSCAIRIQMPNRYMIQSKFSTVETVGVIMDFIRKFLIDPDLEFHLFLTPPKMILDKSATLIESNCVPSALLHFGCEVVAENHLKPELFEKLSTLSGASRVLLTDGNLQTASGSNEKCSDTKKPVVPQNFMHSKTTSEATGAIPKWFKRGK